MKFRGVALSFLVTTAVLVTVSAIADGAPNGDSTSGLVGGQYNNYGYSQQQNQHQQQQQSNYGQPVQRSYEDYSYQQGRGQPQQEQYGYNEAAQQEQNQEQALEQTQDLAKGEEEGYQTGAAEEKLPPLPEGWSEFSDPSSGRPYYYHAEKRITTWVRPLPPPAAVPDDNENASEEASIATDTADTDRAGFDVAEQRMNEQQVVQEQPMDGGVEEDGVVVEEYGTTGQHGYQHQQSVGEQSEPAVQEDDSSANVVSEVGAGAIVREIDTPAAVGGDPVEETLDSPEEERYQSYSANQSQSQQGWGLSQEQQQQMKQRSEANYNANETQLNKVPTKEEQQWKSPDSSWKQQEQPLRQILSSNPVVDENKQQQLQPPQSSSQYGHPQQQEQNRMEQKKPTDYYGGPPQQQHQQQRQPSNYYGRNPPQQQRPQYYGGPPQQSDGQRHQPPPSEPQQHQQWGRPTLEPPKPTAFAHQQRSGSLLPQKDTPAVEAAAAPPGKLRQLWGKVVTPEARAKPVTPSPDVAVSQNSAPQPGPFVSPGLGGGTRMPPPNAAVAGGRNPGAGYGFGDKGLTTDPGPGGRAQGPGGVGSGSIGPGPTRGTGGMPPQHQPPMRGGPPQIMPNHPGGGHYPPPQSRQQPPPGQYGSQPGMYGHQQYQQQGSGPGYDPYGAGPGTNNNQNSEPVSTLKGSIGTVWEGVMGFGNRTKAVVAQTTETVVESVSHVSENVGTTGMGVWDRVKASAGTVTKSLFDSNTEQNDPSNYSLSPYGGQPPMSGQPPQHRQQYPPQNYGGYPPGPGYPGPRRIQPYPHQGGMPQQQQPRGPPGGGGDPRGPPLQSQWGEQHNRRQGEMGGPGPGPQGQYGRRAPGEVGQPGPENGVRSPPQQQQQQPPPQEGRSTAAWDPAKERGRGYDPSAHPAYNEGY